MRVRLATHVGTAATVTRLAKHDAPVQRHLPSTPSSSDVRRNLFSLQPKLVSITTTDRDKSARGLPGIGAASRILLEVSAGQLLQSSIHVTSSEAHYTAVAATSTALASGYSLLPLFIVTATSYTIALLAMQSMVHCADSNSMQQTQLHSHQHHSRTLPWQQCCSPCNEPSVQQQLTM